MAESEKVLTIFPQSAYETWITASLGANLLSKPFSHSLESAFMSRLLQQSVPHRLLASLTALTFVAVLASCSNDDAPELDETTDASDAATTEYIPASADGPAQNVPEPKLPAVATENTEEGAEASFEFFWQAEEYARLTGETRAISMVSSADCAFCTESIEGWKESYEDGYWTAIQGDLSVDITDVQTAADDADESPIAHLYFQLHEPATDFYDADGNRTDSSFESPESHDWFALMSYDATAQRWQVDWLGLEDSVTWED